MEVDLQPATESRHSSPFARMQSPVSAASATASTSVSPSASSSGQRMEQKKRRRAEVNTRSGSHYEEDAGYGDDERVQSAGPSAKRRNVLLKRVSDDSTHHFRSLGSATGLGGAWLSDSEYYGVDSPMHSLSLASPSPPPTQVASETDGGGDASDDIDMMGFAETIVPSASPHPGQAVPLIPRQVLHRSHSTPFRPSPLIQAQAFTSSSSQSNKGRSYESATSSLSPSCIAPDPEVERTRRDDIADGSPSSHSPSSSSRMSSPRRRLDGRATPTSLEEQEGRTPSPGAHSDDQPGRSSRRLHHSPGLVQTSFPGGKHMLRYTMGYRDDCAACKSKTPGHYGHVMHR